MPDAAPEPLKDPPKAPWKSEPWDRNLPSLGFVTDFVLHKRGMEAPTIYAAWVSLWLVSTILKRNAWLRWGRKPFYPNLYAILIGPPRFNAKSEIIRAGTDILDELAKALKQNQMTAKTPRQRQDAAANLQLWKPNLIRTKVTPESLAASLSALNQDVAVGNAIITTGSQAGLVATELGTFLDRKKYNQGIVELLTHLYDSPDYDEIGNTISRGIVEVYKVYLTLIAATTPKALADTLPETAFGDGFLSRVVTIYQLEPTRAFYRPKDDFPGVPSIEEMARRLWWIASNMQGPYDFSKEADEYLEANYFERRKEMAKTISDPTNVKGILYRRDIITNRVAILVRAQRYDPVKARREDGALVTEITLADIQEAERLLESTLTTSFEGFEHVNVGTYEAHKRQISRLIQRRKTCTVRELMTATTRIGNSAYRRQMVQDLLDEGRVEVRSEKNLPRETVQKTSTDEIIWTGEPA